MPLTFRDVPALLLLQTRVCLGSLGRLHPRRHPRFFASFFTLPPGNGYKTVFVRYFLELPMNDVLTHQSLCESIVEQIPLAIIFGDREGIVRLWNAGAEAMFGWSADEALGKSMDMIIPEKHRARHWEGYFHVMETALTKDGRRISVEFNIALLKAADGRILGAGASIQDVTARWERDKALRARLAELEAKLKQAGVAP